MVADKWRDDEQVMYEKKIIHCSRIKQPFFLQFFFVKNNSVYAVVHECNIFKLFVAITCRKKGKQDTMQ